MWTAMLLLALVLLWSRALSVSAWLLAPASSDASIFLMPMHGWVFGELRQGRGLPLWNPLVMGGLPVIETMQAAVFYPPAWIYALLEPVSASNLLLLAHLWGSAFAMWLLLGAAGLPSVPACIGGLVYGLGGYAMLRAGSGEWRSVWGMPWIPLMCLSSLDLMRGRAFRALALGGLAGGLLLVSADPRTVVVGLCVYALFATAFSVWGREETTKTSRVGAASLSFASLALALALGAAQWLPVAEYVRLAPGAAIADRPFLISNTYPAYFGLGLVLPRLFAASPAVGLNPVAANVAPCGVLALALCLAAVAGLSRRRSGNAPMPRTQRVIGFYSLLLLLGSAGFAFSFSSPPYQALAAVPPEWLTPLPRDLFLASALAFAVLAALGANALVVAPEANARVGRFFLLAAGVAGIAYVLLFFPSARDGDHWKIWTKGLLEHAARVDPAFRPPSGEIDLGSFRQDRFALLQHDVLKGLGLLALAGLAIRFLPSFARSRQWLGYALLALLVFDLMDYALPLRSPTAAEDLQLPPDLVRAMRERKNPQDRFTVIPESGISNLCALSGIGNASGCAPMAPERLVYLWAADQEADERPSSGIVKVAKATPLADRWSVRWAWLNGIPSESFYGWSLLENAQEGALMENRRALPRARFVSRDKTSPVEILEDSWGLLRLQGSFPTRGSVVVADTWMPGWRATVDGRATPLQRADGGMRAVSVDAGAHGIEMRYAGTESARAGRWISLAALLFVLSVGARHRYNLAKAAKAAR